MSVFSPLSAAEPEMLRKLRRRLAGVEG